MWDAEVTAPDTYQISYFWFAANFTSPTYSLCLYSCVCVAGGSTTGTLPKHIALGFVHDYQSRRRQKNAIWGEGYTIGATSLELCPCPFQWSLLLDNIVLSHYFLFLTHFLSVDNTDGVHKVLP